jgi:sodium transport system permease protein
MRWSIIRLIWHRELRDQLRDRRTLFMIAVLPILLYPVAGFGVMKLALGFLQQQNVVGVQGARYLPAWTPRAHGLDPLPGTAWLTLAPAGPTVPLAGLDRALSAAALSAAAEVDPHQSYPPLFVGQGDDLGFASLYFEQPQERKTLSVRLFDDPMPDVEPGQDPQTFLSGIDRSALESKQVDLLLVVPANFTEVLERDGRPPLYVLTRADERSRLVDKRLAAILARWKVALKEVRLRRLGLPADYDEAFVLHDEARDKPVGRLAAEHLFEALVRIFPFVLVMWSLAGALYPAVDLCAGEKERGTMETLLISPASREEIVWGKFLTIWLFSAATALLNLLSMGATTWLFSPIPTDAFRPAALFWSLLLLLPLSAFFSALCLAVGAYARSSKEGQYYLMPLFLVTMPLIFLTLAPGVELNAFYSMVPVTGVALLLQKLMASTAGNGPWLQAVPWLYFLPVLAPMILYSWLALRWAIEQFQRDEVLFREAERLDLGLWLRHLLRDKEPLPSAGQAFFCFGLILALQALTASATAPLALTAAAIRPVAFVATPAVMIALLLTTRPREGLALRRVPPGSVLAGGLLALLLTVAAALLVAHLDPATPLSLQPLGRPASGPASLHGLAELPPASRWQFLLILGVLPALCEEIAFRGLILSGLERRFRPWTAVLLSSFLYAVCRMHIFQLVPFFLAGVVLALIVRRTRSLWPALAFHLVWNLLLLGPVLFPEMLHLPAGQQERLTAPSILSLVVLAGCLLGAGPLLVRLCWPVDLPGEHPPAPAGRQGPVASPYPVAAGTAALPRDTSVPPPY